MVENLLILAAIQGITEFLPISSSAHLILFPRLTGVADQGLVIDVAAHFGTLIAVILYNFRAIREMLAAFFSCGRYHREMLMPSVMVLVATVPLIIIGYLISHYDIVTLYLRNIQVIGWTTLIFGVLLGVSDRNQRERSMITITLREAIVIGLAQPLALIPGTSRSGICMTMARFSGLSRRASARFAMILSIPAILGASVQSTSDLMMTGAGDLIAAAMLVAVLALGFALVSISLMMRLIHHIGFMPFVLYRIVLGCILLLVAYIV